MSYVFIKTIGPDNEFDLHNVLIAMIHIVSRRYPKDQDVQLICDAFEKVLIKLEGKE